jgi:bifunctional UDP-N-acetylglucosamine pyrophosphorylase/glucosamine-1-phosphate N-acetyltransferase
MPESGTPPRPPRPRAGKRGLLVVILAAGQGSRMKSSVPKVLHPVAGEPLLAYPLAMARTLRAAEIAVVHAPGQDRLLAEVVRHARLVVQPRARGTGNALKQVPTDLRECDEVLVLYGDVPLLTTSTVRALLQVRRRKDLDVALLAARVDNPGGYGRVVHDEDGPRIVEETDASPAQLQVNLVNTGVCVFRSEALWPALNRLKPSPVTGEFYLTEVFGSMPRRALLECQEEEALGVNDRWQLAAAERVLRQRINRGLAMSGVTIVDPASTFIDAGVTVEPDAVIEPFTFLRGQTSVGARSRVGPFAEITDSRVGQDVVIGRSHLVRSTIEDGVSIGPFNRLRAGSVVARGARVGSYAEIKNTLVGPDSDVHHFSYLGDAVLGKGVNIGAGTVTANYDGRVKRQTVIADGVFIGSDSTLVAPVTIGEGAYTAAGSVISRDVAAGSLAIERNEQREVEGWARRRSAKR